MKNKIPQQQIDELRKSLVGKRVSVYGQKYQGKSLGAVCGVCEYFGYNERFPSWDYRSL